MAAKLNSPSYYQLLGLTPDAPHDRIRAKYRLLAFQVHPDRDTGDENLFKKYTAAYEVLSDPIRRQKYNQTVGIKAKPRPLKKGHDLHQRLDIPQELAETGGKTVLRFIRYEPCSLCWLEGCHRCKELGQIPEEISISVTIASNTKNGATIILEKQGSASEPGGPRGDLLIRVFYTYPQTE